MRHLFVGLLAFAFFSGSLASPAESGAIQDHAIVAASAGTDGLLGPAPEVVTVGNGALTTGNVSAASTQTFFASQNDGVFILPQNLSAQGAAGASPYASGLLGASSSATGDPARYSYPFTSAPAGGLSYGSSYAAWTDIAYVAGPQQPAALNFKFAIEGQFTTTPGQILGTDTGESSQATIGVTFASQVVDFAGWQFNFGQPVNFNGIQAQTGYDNTLPAGWSDQNGLLTGTATYQANYDATLGGYAFSVGLSTQVSARPESISSSAVANFLDTLSLTSVTAADGTPVSVSFDSGLTFASVPEPSSMVISLIGLAIAGGLLGCHRIRTGRTARSALG